MKERVRKVGHAMQPAVQARAGKHARHQSGLTQKGASVLDIATEVAGGDECCGDDFRIGLLSMTPAFEPAS
jgi:hypothetical protein